MAIVTILACIAAFLYLIHIWWNKKKVDLPSPKGLPILGNLLQFRTNRPDLKVTEWAKELGPIFKLHILNHVYVFVSDYKHIHEVLVTKGKQCGGRPSHYGNRSKYIWEYDTSVFVNNPGPQWKFLRNTLHTNVKMYDEGLKKVESVNMSVISDLVCEFKSKGSQPFNPWEGVLNAVMNIICTFLVGRTFKSTDEVFELFKMVERETATCLGPGAEGSELDVLWCLRHFGTKSFKRLESIRDKRRKLWTIVKKDFDDRRSATKVGDEMQNFGLVGVMLSALEEAQKNNTALPGNVTEKNIMLTFHDLIFAGSTTTTNTFYAFLKVIIQSPDVQKNLREEVDEVVGPDRMVQLTDKHNMPYCRATILELLRYTSIVPLGVVHNAQEDLTIQGHTIPKDTPIITNTWGMHHDPLFWKDPFVFRPDRFLEDNGDVVPPDHENRKHLMPFGAGTRVCLGESFAIGRLFLLIATMAQMFEMKPGPVEESIDARLFRTGAVISPSDFKMKFVVRNEKLFV